MGLILSARFIVIYGISIAVSFSIPLVLVGLLALSLSTSLPELAFEYQAAKRGFYGMALGDLLGSVVTNSALVLGVVALISSIRIENFNLFLANTGFLVLVLLVFFFFTRKGEGLSRMEGAGLLLLYLLFLVLNFSFLML